MSAHTGCSLPEDSRGKSETLAQIWSGARSPVERLSARLFHSLFFLLSRLRILSSSSSSSSSHTDSSASRGSPWQPPRHSEDPALMFRRSVARLHHFPVSVARGAKALNCCLEMLSGSFRKQTGPKMFPVQDCGAQCIFNS